ncbi:SsrA-binding protein SmpB [Candidatus Peregrinibacteria bacterium]|nr:SsrA-binding protein SmpB [Candidatus Peregrinibacteria bacterium]
MKIITQNKKALFHYEILEKAEAGIILSGAEVKAIRTNLVNLKGGYISIQNGETFLENVHIGKYAFASDADYDPKKRRKLLLNKREIEKFALQLNQKGITIIPLEVIIKNNRIKIIIGLCRGKKGHDKRDVLKKKAEELEIKKSLKRFSR